MNATLTFDEEGLPASAADAASEAAMITQARRKGDMPEKVKIKKVLIAHKQSRSTFQHKTPRAAQAICCLEQGAPFFFNFFNG
jgi:hypothetical protein